MPFAYETPYTIVSNSSESNYNKTVSAAGYSWHGSAPFARSGNEERFVLALNTDQSVPSLLGIACWCSTDRGQTWLEVGALDRPTPPSDYYNMPVSWCYDDSGDGVWVSYQNASEHLSLMHFDMPTYSWGTEYDSGISLTKMPTSVPVCRADGSVVVLYNDAFSASAGFVVFDPVAETFSTSTALPANFRREVQCAALHTSTGNIHIIGMNASGFVYSAVIDPSNAVSTPVALPNTAWSQTGGKCNIDGDTIYHGMEWFDDPPMELKLLTAVGEISGTSVTWGGTLSGVLSNGATPPMEEPQEDNYYNGAFVGPSGAQNTKGVHFALPSWINVITDPGTPAIVDGLFYSHLRKFTSTDDVIDEGSGVTLHSEENTFFNVCAARLPSGDIGLTLMTVDNLLGGRNSTVDDRLIYMELQGSRSANRWYSIGT